MLEEISRQALTDVSALQAQVTATRYHKTKKTLFTAGIDSLTPEGVLLFTFCCWFCTFNARFKAIEPSNYYGVPARTSSVTTFRDFLELLRYYQRLRVTPSREGALLKFLAQCDQADQDFYLMLLAKKFTQGLPVLEMQTTLDLQTISVAEVYGVPVPLRTSFANLHYPVVIAGISAAGAQLAVVSKQPRRKVSLLNREGKFEKAKFLLPADLHYIKEAQFTLAGFTVRTPSGRLLLHPIDYFPTRGSYVEHLQRKEGSPYPQRLARLRDFQQNNLLTQVSTGYIGLAFTEAEVLAEICKVMADEAYRYVVLCDDDTLRSGRAHLLEVRIATGIIESFWVDPAHPQGVAGIHTWFNGELLAVPYSFTGHNNSLLNSIEALQGKLLEFYYLRLGAQRLAAGIRIRWDDRPWRPFKMRGSAMRIDKCALCGSTRNKHARRGLCKVCECNLYRWFTVNGPERWIPPTKPMTKKREESVWEPQLLNLVQYTHEGHRLEARDDGYWRFKSPSLTKEEP